ncbi:MAG: YceI family protein [Bacteroidetes bacterium]|nr:YceI family protein [Bacteroidota bacterium]
MKAIIKSLVLSLLIMTAAFAGGFDINTKGEQTFSFKDKVGRNQATFFSTTPLEDITGMSTDVWGTVSFDIEDVENTLKGEILISTASLKSGIDLRDEHISSADWLDAEKFPTISFKIKEVTGIEKIEDNKLKAKVLGEFTVHGVTMEVESEVTLVYLEENEMTKMRLPGDLLGVRAKININLSDYGIQHMVLDQKVSDEIEINVNIVGSNKM